MKCVCPMGGNRTCPDDCWIGMWYKLPDDQKTKERRLPIVAALAKQGYTQDAIAMQLGVGQNTIHHDLATLSIVDNVKGQGKDTLGRKKSTGRPKGSTKPRKNESVPAEVAAEQIVDGDKSYKEAERETGLSNTVLRSAVAREEGRREALQQGPLEPGTLAPSAQQKLEAAIRQAKKNLEVEFEMRVQQECQRRLDEMSLPAYAKEIKELEWSIRARKGVMDRITYRKILACLHPDRVQDAVLKKRFEEAFRLFTDLEKRLLDEKESPTEFRNVPRTWQEMMEMKAKVKAERRSKREAAVK